MNNLGRKHRKVLVSLAAEELRFLYWDKGLTLNEIGKRYGVAGTTIMNKMKAYNIPTTRPQSGAITQCRMCGKSFYVFPCRNNKAKFCSCRCSNKWRSTYVVGEKHYHYGKQLSEEHRQKIRSAHVGKHYSISSEFRKGHKPWNKGRKYIGEERERLLKQFMSGWGKKPTKPEQMLGEVLDRYFPGEWKYVGDGSVTLGCYNPDFINCNGKKKLIELFGTYWHDVFDVARKTEHYRQYGFETLVIWDDEIRCKSEEDIAVKVKKFDKGVMR